MNKHFKTAPNTEDEFMNMSEEQLNEIANLSFKEMLRLFFFGKYEV